MNNINITELMNNKLLKIYKKANINLHNPSPKAFLSKAYGHSIQNGCRITWWFKFRLWNYKWFVEVLWRWISKKETTFENILFDDFVNPWNLCHVFNQSDEVVMKWCLKNGLISSELECPTCGGQMKLARRGSKATSFSFRWNINWRDVQTKNVANNVDMSCLRAPWQNGPYKN